LSTKRHEIIAQAAVLMHSKGYENTKLADILDVAQIGKGQFYHYFSSKHELGLAVLDLFFANWNQRLMENILSSDKDAKTKINEMFDWIIEQHRRNQAKCGCVFGNLAIEMSEHDETFRSKLEAVFETWESKLKPLLRELVSPVEVDPLELNRMAQSIVAMIEGGILLMKSKQDVNVLINIVDQAQFLIGSFVQQHSDVSVTERGGSGHE
jgi:TetR/AcrR family transcriptional repressor of nem operon